MDDSEGEDAGEENPEAEDGPQTKGQKSTGENCEGQSPSKEKWFDAESKTRKAERAWDTQMNVLKRDLETLSASMSSTLADFRSTPSDAQEFAAEMLLVQKRHEWVLAVLQEDESVLNEKISAQRELAEGVDSVTESRDATAIARAGPCAGYEGLMTHKALASKGAGFRTCASQDDIKKFAEKLVPGKKLVATLMSASKGSVNELVAARKKSRCKRRKRRRRS